MIGSFFGRDISRDKSWSEDPLWLRCAVLATTGAIWCVMLYAVLH